MKKLLLSLLIFFGVPQIAFGYYSQTEIKSQSPKTKKQACFEDLEKYNKVFKYSDFSLEKMKAACKVVCNGDDSCYIIDRYFARGSIELVDIGAPNEQCFYEHMSYDQNTAYKSHLLNVKWREDALKQSGYLEQQREVCNDMK